MRILEFVWLDEVIEKLFVRHDVVAEEVEEVFEGRPIIFKAEAGKRKGEDLYNALGRTEAGRYLSVFFIRKLNGDALIISARDMNHRERKRYGNKKKG
ncbi:MAG: BrnT family toxin [Bacteroidota bacterium]